MKLSLIHCFLPSSCMTPSPEWWNTCQVLTTKCSAISTSSQTLSTRRWRVTRRTWTTAIPGTTLTLSSLKWRKYVNYWSHCDSPPPLDPLFTAGILSVFLNSTKSLTWASLRPIWLCALWTCSWLEQRQPPPHCCGLWFIWSNTQMSRVGDMQGPTLWGHRSAIKKQKSDKTRQ